MSSRIRFVKEADVPKERHVTPTIAARRLGVGLDYLYKQIWAAKLPARKVNGRWRIRLAVVEQRLHRREARNG